MVSIDDKIVIHKRGFIILKLRINVGGVILFMSQLRVKLANFLFCVRHFRIGREEIDERLELVDRLLSVFLIQCIIRRQQLAELVCGKYKFFALVSRFP